MSDQDPREWRWAVCTFACVRACVRVCVWSFVHRGICEHMCVSVCACGCHNNDHLTLLSIPQGSALPSLTSWCCRPSLSLSPSLTLSLSLSLSLIVSLSHSASSRCSSRLGTVGVRLLIHSWEKHRINKKVHYCAKVLLMTCTCHWAPPKI